jgi:hydrogenase nickel incorporation protein HypB
MLQLAARRTIDIDSWLDWLRHELADHRRRVARHETLRPNIQPEGAALHTSQHQGHSHSHDHEHEHKHS